jgi:hypothetical protein
MGRLRRFIIISIIIISLSLAIAYEVQAMNKPYDDFNFRTFINDGPNEITLKDIIVGLTFGTVLGFVDTVGIWIGVEEISNYIPGGVNIKSAVGGIYSNILGITVGTAISIIIGTVIKTDNNQTPIYLTAAGSIIGAILGIAVGNTFF